jgi:hypothetical protein
MGGWGGPTVPILDFRGLRISHPQAQGRVMVNWDPPTPAGPGWRQVPDPTRRNTEYVPGRPFAIFIQVTNRGRNGCIKSWFCQYISLPMKYTVNGSILQYKV